MLAVSVRSTDAAQLLIDYINAANVVARYAAQVHSTTLPVLVTPPANYATFADTLGGAKLHALSWIDEMVPAFTAIPSSIVNYNGIVQPQLQAMSQALEVLRTDPNNSAARTIITTSISTLQTDLAPCLQTASDLDSWIGSYSATLSPDAAALTGLCGQITAAENVDLASIAMMKGCYANLQTAVDDRNEIATLDTIGNAVFSIVLGVVGAAVGAPFSGPAALIVGVLVGVASGAFTAFFPILTPPDYQETLQTLQDDMSAINSEIGLVNTIVTLLQTTSEALAALVTQSSAASESVQDVLAFWQSVQSDLDTTATELEAILTDLDANSIDAAQAQLSAASAEWAALETSMASLAGMSYQMSNTIDMGHWSPPT